jgi:hypothetical protein
MNYRTCKKERVSEIPVPPKLQYCSTLISILQNEDTKDLTLKIREQSLKVHSCFLAEQSLKFAALVAKQKNKCVKITDITFDQLKHLINFIYNDIIDNLEEKVEEIYPAASKVCQLLFSHFPIAMPIEIRPENRSELTETMFEKSRFITSQLRFL